MSASKYRPGDHIEGRDNHGKSFCGYVVDVHGGSLTVSPFGAATWKADPRKCSHVGNSVRVDQRRSRRFKAKLN